MHWLFSFIVSLLLMLVASNVQAESLYPVRDQSGMSVLGYINSEGKVVISERFEDARDFSEGLAPVSKGGKWGYIDSSGRMVIEPQFEFAYPFNEGLAAVQISNIDWDNFDFGSLSNREAGSGFIDKSGRIVIYPIYNSAFGFNEGLAPVKKDGKWGFLNHQGDWAIPPQFYAIEGPDLVIGFINGVSPVCTSLIRRNGHEQATKCGLIDRSGNFVVRPEWDFIESFSEGLALAQEGGRSYYLNQQGNPVITLPEGADAWSSFSQGRAPVRIGDKTGYIDRTGQFAIEPVFSDGYPFSEGLAAVYIAGRLGFIDPAGQFVINPRFNLIYNEGFYKGLAWVWADEQQGYIDKTGRFIWTSSSP